MAKTEVDYRKHGDATLQKTRRYDFAMSKLRISLSVSVTSLLIVATQGGCGGGSAHTADGGGTGGSQSSGTGGAGSGGKTGTGGSGGVTSSGGVTGSGGVTASGGSGGTGLPVVSRRQGERLAREEARRRADLRRAAGLDREEPEASAVPLDAAAPSAQAERLGPADKAASVSVVAGVRRAIRSWLNIRRLSRRHERALPAPCRA